MCVGILVSEDEVKKNLADIRKFMLGHATGVTKCGQSHIEAIGLKNRKDELQKTNVAVMQNHVSAALQVIKTKSASLHLESNFALLYAAGAEIGTMNHSRYV